MNIVLVDFIGFRLVKVVVEALVVRIWHLS